MEHLFTSSKFEDLYAGDLLYFSPTTLLKLFSEGIFLLPLEKKTLQGGPWLPFYKGRRSFTPHGDSKIQPFQLSPIQDDNQISRLGFNVTISPSFGSTGPASGWRLRRERDTVVLCQALLFPSEFLARFRVLERRRKGSKGWSLGQVPPAQAPGWSVSGRFVTLTFLACFCRLSGSASWAPRACNAGDKGDAGSIPGLGRSSGEGNGNQLQYSCPEIICLGDRL